ncbi:PREDICTED: uncharacterized protein LOC101313494 [Fragaria vesca subsp. vesca]
MSIDTIGPNQYVKDDDIIVSKQMKFELGFFSPGNSSYRYLGIWYANIPEKPVIWVANRDNPITDSSGVLTNRYGNLVLYAYKENLTIWSTEVSVQTTSSTSAQILDTGNLVLVQGNNEEFIWQSFDYPTDTMIPGMKLGLNRETGLDSFITSWKSEDDPGTGDYSYRLNLTGAPQFILYNRSSKYFRTAMWPWSPSPSTTPYAYDYNFVNNQDETSLIDSSDKSSEISRLVVNHNGILQHLTWNDVESRWKEMWAAPKFRCDPYGHCGAFSECSLDNIQSECSCLPGYEPSSSGNWSEGIWSDGCVSKQVEVSNKCGKNFVKVEHVKLPDASISALLDTQMGESECKRACQNNCSCVAYASLQIDGGGGCMAWYGELMDTLILAEQGRDFYVRADGTEAAENDRKPSFLRRRGMLAVLILPAVLALSVIMMAYWWLIKRKTEAIILRRTWGRQYSHFSTFNEPVVEHKVGETRRHPDLQLFYLSTIKAATDDFSLANKLGEGGFGSVYKGHLSNQQKIAVKRLSKSSRQGVEEFKNEVTLIAKLQHRNLVKLLGCCIEEEEKLLIYEYLPNKSLDFFLFDQTRRSALDWRNRFAIITGVARGILYLHEDSRLRIVHRDLKASNILLDADMKPKISDFGLARIFDGDQLQDVTRKIVGTYGYMSPEYAGYGKFSTKSDVFSFGVIVLEIISGKKNNASYEEDHSINLIGHVWDLWREHSILDIVDVVLESYNIDEVLRCLQIGLLCLEEDTTDRPTMSEVVLMLSGERALASPQRPAFIFKKTCHNSSGLLITERFSSTNDITVTDVLAKMVLKSLLLFLLFPFCKAIDTIGSNQYVKDGDTLISTEKKFELGFFSPGNSSYRYVGIWYAEIPENPVVWVANRDNPINDSSGVLTINRYGSLVMYAHNREDLVIWSTKALVQTTSSTTSARLLDTGNLVLFQGNNDGDVLWQSFDYPTDTMLPGMKLGLNRVVKLDSFLTSWKSQFDPGTGDFSYSLNPTGSPQFFMYNGSTPMWRSSPWPWQDASLTPNYVDIYTMVNNPNETYMIVTSDSTSGLSRLVVNYSGTLQQLTWNNADSRWEEIWVGPKYKCDRYGDCGTFSTCIPDNIQFECACLPGYQPRSLEHWNQRNGSDGCVSNKPVEVERSQCKNGEAFRKVDGVKLPDASISAWFDTNLSEKDCRSTCQKNCSCVAYSSVDYDGGVGCLIWYGDLMDTLLLSYGGRDLYIRGDTLESGTRKSRGFMRRRGMLPILILAVSISLLLIMFAYWWLLKRHTTKGMRTRGKCSLFSSYNESMVGNKLEETRRHSDLQIFDLSTVIAATEDFSHANKIGEGGFGSVYKGKLANEQKIAVKRLSRCSSQGIEEFKNEVMLIAKLQHRNLVKLLGCCIEQEEKLLIYEYLPNKSLDYFLFDQTRRSSLDWRTRFDIIIGVARGILYLHQDSRLRIIHRDLKPSNVLLDADMKPKISDFGMARIFNGDLLHDKTNRVVGTFGYMSPEYAVYGKFSTKSDVFSFGVILLEIVSGKKNNASYQEEHSLNLIGHVWDLWKEKRVLDIVDPELESYEIDEVLRCIQIGLLCLQEDVMDRPTMSEVVLMLSGERALASPQRPAFVFKFSIGDSLVAEGVYCSNNLTITNVIGR